MMIDRIEQAEMTDLDRLMEIFGHAREFMRSVGNPNQWINGYPQRELIEAEIEAGHCQVCRNEDNRVVATFCFIAGPDPTYSYIEGEWPNDEPYHVIHRVASDGTCHGVMAQVVDWCAERSRCLRADTHADNKVMQRALENSGFRRCGIIYVANGTPRIAYQRQ